MTLFRQLLVWLSNLAWWLSCLPGWIGFLLALPFPERTQRRLLRHILAANRHTQWGTRAGFAGLANYTAWQRQPVTDYTDYESAITTIAHGRKNVLTPGRVLLLEPTSGSSGRNKLIPYTLALQADFRRALDPWIGSLYLHHPGVLTGRHYWSITPSTPTSSVAASSVPVGFADDSAYLGPLQRLLANTLFAVPAAVAQVRDPASVHLLTALFLAAAPDLTLISIWHPTYLETILEVLATNSNEIVTALRDGRIPLLPGMTPEIQAVLNRKLRAMPRRAGIVAATLARNDIQALWPHLRVISCWDEALAAAAARSLMLRFPLATLQGKGLLATEGVITIPMGARHARVAAVRSHVLEFEDADEKQVYPLWQLQNGREYSVLLTTSGGLYRYRLGDRVRCTGRIGRTPCLTFLGREGIVCDLTGEKLSDLQVAQALRRIDPDDTCAFAMLAPAPQGRGYELFVDQTTAPRAENLAIALDAELRANYHYHHARTVGQLHAITAVCVPQISERFRAIQVARGIRSGAIKVPSLDLRSDWAQAFFTIKSKAEG